MTLDALERELRRIDAESAATSVTVTEVPADAADFARSVGIEPDPWQERVLSSTARRKLLCCGRQCGKSTVGAVLAIHKALTVAGSTVLVVAPGERQAKLLFSKAAALYRRAGHPLPAHSERRTGLELSNGSLIEAVPAVERTTRGYSVDLLVCDEAAGVPDFDYYGILPALIATQGEQVLLSTPRGKRGFFWELWSEAANGARVAAVDSETGVPPKVVGDSEAGEDEDILITLDGEDAEIGIPSDGEDEDIPITSDGETPKSPFQGGDLDSADNQGWLRVMVRSDEVPRIRDEDLDVFRGAMPLEFFRQEFECAFLETEGALFAHEDVEAALNLGLQVQAIELGVEGW